jgi:5-methylcytosine-specific restriction endonuclease McrA
VAQNLVAACADCNRDKGSTLDWVGWFRRQPFWDAGREADIWSWLHPARAA